jgi:hypothetical protein
VHRRQLQLQAVATRGTGLTMLKTGVPRLPRQQSPLAAATTTREAGTTTVDGTETMAGWVPMSQSRCKRVVDVKGQRKVVSVNTTVRHVIHQLI